MSTGNISNSIDIAVSGLRAESARMKAITGNIANSSTTRTPSGEPYRRMSVLLATEGAGISGVKVQQIAPDMTTAFKRVHQPEHPDADKDGYVLMPNVDLPVEMMNLVAASRAYQANAAILKRYQEIMDLTIELLR